jgi:hypothetical protein
MGQICAFRPTREFLRKPSLLSSACADGWTPPSVSRIKHICATDLLQSCVDRGHWRVGPTRSRLNLARLPLLRGSYTPYSATTGSSSPSRHHRAPPHASFGSPSSGAPRRWPWASWGLRTGGRGRIGGGGGVRRRHWLIARRRVIPAVKPPELVGRAVATSYRGNKPTNGFALTSSTRGTSWVGELVLGASNSVSPARAPPSAIGRHRLGGRVWKDEPWSLIWPRTGPI